MGKAEFEIALARTIVQDRNPVMLDLSDIGIGEDDLANLIPHLADWADLTILDLSGNQLTALPEALGQLFQLTYLDLSKNQLTALPKCLEQLSQLTYLDLGGNQLTAQWERLGKLSQLTELDLSANQLIALPEPLGQLSQLTELHLSGNRLTALPKFLGQLFQLTELDLSRNQLTALPEFLGQLFQLTDLDLSENQLTTLPEFLGQFSQLTELHLSGNKLTFLPEFLGRLSRLTNLDLSENQLTALPEFLGQLSQLTELNLSENQLIALPGSLSRLSHLTHLGLSDNWLTALPDFVGQFSQLTELYLGGNQLTALPESLGQLSQLTSLGLGGNQLTALPESLGQLSQLTFLGLGGNQLANLPESLGQLSQLTNLVLGGNQLTALPESLANLNRLQYISLDANPLPGEILAAARQGVRALFRLLKSQGKVSPRTVKTVLLGEPQSGKTTLREALKGNKKPCDPKRKETMGVDVTRIEKTCPLDDRPMTLAVWDFAGQHMEHATHQFYLTDQAVYLILWNARLGAESGKRDVWYWLELLKMRVSNPEFLLVATHTKYTPADLNVTEIKNLFPGFRGLCAIELETLEGVADLEKKILEVAAASPAMRAEWPKPWVEARDAIRQLRIKKPWLTPGELRKVIRSHGITKRVEVGDLTRQLHLLGEILYFEDHPHLAKLVVLSPEWLSELIALVVRDAKVREAGGILRKKELERIWKKAKLPPRVRQHLVRLMDHFDLTYDTGDSSDVGMVVESLRYANAEQAVEAQLPAEQPAMEFVFRFPKLQRRLPPGVPTWAVARAHRYLDRNLEGNPWRNAARFFDEDTKSSALLTASDTSKEVRLRVAGDYPPFFFGQMKAILEDTFRRYPGVEPELRVACNCRPGCPQSFLYQSVLAAVQDRDRLRCEEPGLKRVDPQSLMTGFLPSNEFGFLAVREEMRQEFLALRRGLSESMQRQCPTTFTLAEAQRFRQIDTLGERLTRKTQLELTLYCEHGEFHATADSVYRFRPDQAWVDKLKKGWNGFAAVTKAVAPLLRATGKLTASVKAEAAGMVIDRLPEASRGVRGSLIEKLGTERDPQFADYELRAALKELIEYLDGKRVGQPQLGGLVPVIVETGDLRWLCPEHAREYRRR